MTEKPKNRVRMKPEARKRMILIAAVKVANKNRIASLTFESVAKSCTLHTTPGTVEHYFTINELRQAVIVHANANARVRKDAVEAGLI